MALGGEQVHLIVYDEFADGFERLLKGAKTTAKAFRGMKRALKRLKKAGRPASWKAHRRHGKMKWQ